MIKSLQVDEFGGAVKIVEVEMPKPGPNDVIVQLLACGLCHTDIHLINNDWRCAVPSLPLCPGHEGVGIVTNKGNNVEFIDVGTTVGISWLHYACGRCNYCVSGRENLCYSQVNTGFSVPGCFRQFVSAKASHVIPVPKEISAVQAAPLLCAGITSYAAIKQSCTKPGDFLAIYGAAGGLGHLCIQYAKAMGLRVIAVDVGGSTSHTLSSVQSEHDQRVGGQEEEISNRDQNRKSQLTLHWGAELYIDSSDTTNSLSSEQQIREYTEGLGAHAAIVLAAAPVAYSSAIFCCRRGGTIVAVSLPRDSEITLDINYIVLNNLTIRGSIIGTRQDIAEALEFAARGSVICHVHVEHHLFDSLKKESNSTQYPVSESFERVRHQLERGEITGRVVFDMSDFSHQSYIS